MDFKLKKKNANNSLVKFETPIIISTSNPKTAKKEFSREEDEIFLRKMINERRKEVTF